MIIQSLVIPNITCLATVSILGKEHLDKFKKKIILISIEQ